MGIIEEALVAYTYVGLWIGLSAGVILFNKYVLTVFGFPFPVALTMIHMAFCSALAFLLVRVFKVVKGVNMSRDQYVQRILPIGFLFSIVLWFGNSAYVYLSVAFIQMVKALMPCVVYGVGIAFKVETYKPQTLANMAMIALGVAIASYGELNFNFTGFVLLMGSIAAEAVRIVSIQILLTSADIKLNSVTTLYYVSPACFVFLSVPFVFLEMPKLLSAVDVNVNPGVLLSNATLAFALNISVYLLIGKTSALTMNVAESSSWILIFISFHVRRPHLILALWGYLWRSRRCVTAPNQERAASSGPGRSGSGVKLDQRVGRRGRPRETRARAVEAIPSTRGHFSVIP